MIKTFQQGFTYMGPVKMPVITPEKMVYSHRVIEDTQVDMSISELADSFNALFQPAPEEEKS